MKIKYKFVQTFFLLIILSCKEQKQSSLKHEKNTTVEDNRYKPNIIQVKDTLTYINDAAKAIFTTNFIDENKISFNDKKYLDCGYSDPLHEMYDCSIKKNLKDGVWAIYYDSTFRQIASRHDIKKAKHIQNVYKYHEGVLKEFQGSLFNNTNQHLYIAFAKDGIPLEIRMTDKQTKTEVNKTYDKHGTLQQISLWQNGKFIYQNPPIEIDSSYYN